MNLLPNLDRQIVTEYFTVSESTRQELKRILWNDNTKKGFGILACIIASCGLSYYLYNREYALDQEKLRQEIIDLSIQHLEINRPKIIRLTANLETIRLSTIQLADVHFMYSCTVSKNLGGLLTMHEFTNAMNLYEPFIRPGTIQFRFRLIDRNNHGAVNFLEFAEFIQWLHFGSKEEVLSRIFETVDVHNQGYVHQHDLYWALVYTTPLRSHSSDIIVKQDWDKIIKHLRIVSTGGGEGPREPIYYSQWMSLVKERGIFSFTVFNEFARQTSSLFGYLSVPRANNTSTSSPLTSPLQSTSPNISQTDINHSSTSTTATDNNQQNTTSSMVLQQENRSRYEDQHLTTQPHQQYQQQLYQQQHHQQSRNSLPITPPQSFRSQDNQQQQHRNSRSYNPSVYYPQDNTQFNTPNQQSNNTKYTYINQSPSHGHTQNYTQNLNLDQNNDTHENSYYDENIPISINKPTSKQSRKSIQDMKINMNTNMSNATTSHRKSTPNQGQRNSMDYLP